MGVLVCLGCHNPVPQTGGLQQQKEFSHISGGWESEIKVSARLISSAASLLGLEMDVFSLCPHVDAPLCVSVSSSPLLLGTPGLLD